MNKLLNLSIISTALLVAACSSDDPPPRPPASTTPPPATFNIQVVHAVADAPTVEVSVNGTNVASGVDFKVASGQFVNEATGTYSLSVDANLPDGTTTNVIDVPDFPYTETTFNTVFAIGTVGNISSTTIVRPRTPVAEDRVRVTLLHAAAGAPAVDVYVVAPDVEAADLGMETPLNMAPVTFPNNLETLEIDADDYRIFVTAAGTTNVVFDSGEVTLQGGVDAVVAAVDNTTVGVDTVAVPISVLLVTATGATEIVDQSTVANVRVIHTISDLATPVDIIISEDITTEDDEMQVLNEIASIDGVDFPDVEPTQAPGGAGIDLPGGDYVIQVFQGGTENCLINCGMPAEGETPAEDPGETSIASGTFYDAIAQGLAGGMEDDPDPALVYEVDDLRRIATEAKLRLIHSSGSTGDVDIYVVASTVMDITDVDPTLEDVSFGAAAVESLAAGTYKVIITAADDKTPVITSPDFTVAVTEVYTAIARDADEGEAGPGLILLDDFTTATP